MLLVMMTAMMGGLRLRRAGRRGRLGRGRAGRRSRGRGLGSGEHGGRQSEAEGREKSSLTHCRILPDWREDHLRSAPYDSAFVMPSEDLERNWVNLGLPDASSGGMGGQNG